MEVKNMKKTTVAEISDGMGLTKYTWKVVILVGLVILFDGFDNKIPSYTMTQISKDWGLSGVETGMISSWGGIGLLIGALVAGALADRIGRRKALALGCILYSSSTFFVGLAPNFTIFAIFRILTGFGIGFITPVGATLISEYSPSKNRGFFVAMALVWFILGYTLTGVVSMLTIDIIGWRNLYILGGIAPIIFICFAYRHLPESPRWLLSKGRGEEAVRNLKNMEIAVKGVAGDYDADSIVIPAPPPEGKGYKALLTGKYRYIALNIWFLNLMSVFTVYGMQQWMPSLLVRQGFSVVRSYGFSTLLDAAGIIGVLCTGYLTDKIGRKKNSIIAYSTLAVFELLIGLTTGNMGFLLAAILIIGFTMNWAAGSIQPLFAESWPTEFRASGVGATQAVGRVGSILAPILVGYLVQLNLSFQAILSSFSVPALIAVVIMAFFKLDTKGKSLEEIKDEVANINKKGASV
jgi:benzoate transport